MGVCGRQTLFKWENGHEGSSPLKRDLVKKGKAIIHAFVSGASLDGQIHPTSYVWYSKNNMGYEDKIEHIVTPNNLLGGNVDIEALEERARLSLPPTPAGD